LAGGPGFSAAAIVSAWLRLNQAGSPVSAMTSARCFPSRHAPAEWIALAAARVLDPGGAQHVVAEHRDYT
jgi:hypothetical protein